MKVYYNPTNGQLKVRPSLGPILAIGVTLASIKAVYEFADAMWITVLRRVDKNIPVVRHKLEDVKNELQSDD